MAIPINGYLWLDPRKEKLPNHGHRYTWISTNQARSHMTVQATLQCMPVNYPKPIMAKLLNSQSQSWEMMLSQNAMQLTLPI